MATQKIKKRQRKGSKQRSMPGGLVLVVGVGILVVGLLIFGTAQIPGLGNSGEASHASGIQAGDNNAQTAVDREAQFLGSASNPADLSLAEAGQLKHPTLVWFHADW